MELKTATKIQIPRPDDASNQIRITGTKEGIEKARHEVLLISAEQVGPAEGMGCVHWPRPQSCTLMDVSFTFQDKRAVERLEVEKAFHPFIAGPYNRLVGEIMQETGTRINIPPPSVNRTEIVFTGEKEQLAQAVARIKKIYEEKVAVGKSAWGLSVEVWLRPNPALFLLCPEEFSFQSVRR